MEAESASNSSREDVEKAIQEQNELQRFVTHASRRTLEDELRIPALDGKQDAQPRTKAWIQVFGSFFLFFNTWGLTNAFGVYVTIYEDSFLSQQSSSSLAWIGSVQAFLMMAVGFFTGPVFDAGYCRSLLITGSVLVVFGQLMLSLCKTYVQVFLAQAICVGLGAGLLFIPSVAITSRYFKKNLALANGVATCGSSVGGIIYPIVLYKLLPRLGFAWSTRLVALVSAVCLAISIATVDDKAAPATGRRQLLQLSAFAEIPYTLFVVGCVLTYMGLYIPFFYIEAFDLFYGITDTSTAFYTLAMLNAASIPGRILPNYMSDRLGPFAIIVPASVASGIVALCFTWTRDNPASFLACCVLYGFFSGTLVSVPPVAYNYLSRVGKQEQLGARMGMGFFCTSFGILLGAPVGGWVLRASSYLETWIVSALLMIVGAGIMLLAALADADRLRLRFWRR